MVEFSYDSSQESVPVIAFELDISVSDGIIDSAGNFSSVYSVWPGPIGEEPVTPIVDGLGTSMISISMGKPPLAPSPPDIGVLFTFAVSEECDVTIMENLLRGGVMLDGHIEADIYAPPFHIVPEPATLLLLSFDGLILRRRKRS